MPAPTLRQRLRADTAQSHDALDLMLSRFDLRRADDLARFLAAQHAGFAAMVEAGVEAAKDLVARIESDLATLGAEALAAPPLDRRPHALAADYLLEGSRLGTAVLRRRWAGGSCPRALGASAYFGPAPDTTGWKRVAAHLDSVQANGKDADAVTRDASMLFALFHKCATLAATPIKTEPASHG